MWIFLCPLEAGLGRWWEGEHTRLGKEEAAVQSLSTLGQEFVYPVKSAKKKSVPTFISGLSCLCSSQPQPQDLAKQKTCRNIHLFLPAVLKRCRSCMVPAPIPGLHLKPWVSPKNYPAFCYQPPHQLFYSHYHIKSVLLKTKTAFACYNQASQPS